MDGMGSCNLVAGRPELRNLDLRQPGATGKGAPAVVPGASGWVPCHEEGHHSVDLVDNGLVRVLRLTEKDVLTTYLIRLNL